MADKMLVDTSAWIDFCRMKDPELHRLVATLLREGRACGTGLIVLELIRRASTARKLAVVSELFETIEIRCINRLERYRPADSPTSHRKEAVSPYH